MPFSHHSHSGQFCSHAKCTLEEMIQTAIARKMRVFALTEHMPRDHADLYPEETEAGETEQYLVNKFDAYYAEALRLRQVYGSQIELLIGFETDWIRPSSRTMIEKLLEKFQFDMFMGSVHHVHTIPIDLDDQTYQAARDKSGGTDEKLFEDYFDDQFEMLKATRPPLVGHFDLIRLKSDDPDRTFQQFKGVWRKVLRNLDFIAEYGGILEINSASLRKGMQEPYPKQEICQAFLEREGRFALSDDSHSVEQIGLNYHLVLPFLEGAGIKTIHYLSRRSANSVSKHEASASVSELSTEDLKTLPFWN
ncbi:histidinol-phosphatase [Xylona heveae TC161]|uniref:Histidinol-phosphatase n=1 Tax=Xylona heveae (strain CBS 132557 / TC161) TaxID=1328760 RepID=A0A165GLF0_XYLHT|nr:histidinol-phosphatase [Xylona heveae TC161]KZF22333.1 histidinol-phosphatase [Xylona heveae TC161]